MARLLHTLHDPSCHYPRCTTLAARPSLCGTRKCSHGAVLQAAVCKRYSGLATYGCRSRGLPMVAASVTRGYRYCSGLCNSRWRCTTCTSAASCTGTSRLHSALHSALHNYIVHYIVLYIVHFIVHYIARRPATGPQGAPPLLRTATASSTHSSSLVIYG